MIRLLTNEQMRAADKYTIEEIGIDGEELMRRAGVAIAAEAERVAAERALTEILVVCGNGNNGGDGYVCARVLKEKGYRVAVYAFDGRLSADCRREKDRYFGAYADRIGGQLIIDCIFGTGLSREVNGQYRKAIEEINASGAYVISADVPSGLNGDNGKTLGVAARASLTVAIAEYKMGFFLGDGMDVCGEIVKKDIGIIAEGNFARVYGDGEIRAFYPARRRNSHKGTYGAANIVAGSDRYRGAAYLAAEAALRSGCGYVKLTSCESVIQGIVAAYPQVICLNEADLSCDAIAVGMGCGKSAALYETIKTLLENYDGKLIVDADGLNVLSAYGASVLSRKKCTVLITPHVKEFSRLTGLSVTEILSDPAGYARKFAKEHNIIVYLKGAASIVSDGVNTAVNIRGTTALSKGGSGDILSGLICGNAARGLNLFDAAIASAYVLGKAAEVCSARMTDYCVTAKDLLKNLSEVVKSLDKSDDS